MQILCSDAACLSASLSLCHSSVFSALSLHSILCILCILCILHLLVHRLSGLLDFLLYFRYSLPVRPVRPSACQSRALMHLCTYAVSVLTVPMNSHSPHFRISHFIHHFFRIPFSNYSAVLLRRCHLKDLRFLIDTTM